MIEFIQRITNPWFLLFVVFVVFEFWYMILREPKTKENKEGKTNMSRWIYANGEVLLVDPDDNTKTKPFNSIDEFPINGVPNGAMIHVEDTDDLYVFDEERMLWIKIYNRFCFTNRPCYKKRLI